MDYPNILDSMGFFIADWGIFFCVYQRTKATVLHNRSCSCNHFDGEPGKFFFFTADILWYHSDTHFQFRSLVKISLSVSLFLFFCSVHLRFSTVNCHFFTLSLTSSHLDQYIWHKTSNSCSHMIQHSQFTRVASCCIKHQTSYLSYSV